MRAAAPAGNEHPLAELMADQGVVLAVDRSLAPAPVRRPMPSGWGWPRFSSTRPMRAELAKRIAAESFDRGFLSTPLLGLAAPGPAMPMRWRITARRIDDLVVLQRRLLEGMVPCSSRRSAGLCTAPSSPVKTVNWSRPFLAAPSEPAFGTSALAHAGGAMASTPACSPGPGWKLKALLKVVAGGAVGACTGGGVLGWCCGERALVLGLAGPAGRAARSWRRNRRRLAGAGGSVARPVLGTAVGLAWAGVGMAARGSPSGCRNWFLGWKSGAPKLDVGSGRSCSRPWVARGRGPGWRLGRLAFFRGRVVGLEALP